jgi:hypothetical protein
MKHIRYRLGCILAGAGLSVTVAFSQTAQSQTAPSQLSAREVFLRAVEQPADKSPAAPTQPAPKPVPPKPVAQKAPAQNTVTPPAQAQSTAPAPAPTPVPAPAPTPAPRTSDAPVRASAAPSAVPIVQVAYTRQPLGVRLSLLKTGPNGQTTEVPPDTSFQSGDRVRLNIQVSSNGYLFIINRGSSGSWTQLFPSPELPNASNAVVPGMTYAVPPDRNFVVSGPPGEEKLFVILSRTPNLDVQSLTMDLSQKGTATPAPKPAEDKPIQPSPRTAPGINIAQNHIPSLDDSMVDQMRKMYARDLIIETVDDQTPGTRKENAVYVVNPSDSDDTRVVLDAPIKHR